MFTYKLNREYTIVDKNNKVKKFIIESKNENGFIIKLHDNEIEIITLEELNSFKVLSEGSPRILLG